MTTLDQRASTFVTELDAEISVWAGRMSTRAHLDRWPEAQAEHARLLSVRRAIIAALSGGEAPVAWWNGIKPDVTDRSPYGPSVRWGADAENSRHDIPLYAGYNPVHLTPAPPPALADGVEAKLTKARDGWRDEAQRIRADRDLWRMRCRMAEDYRDRETGRGVWFWQGDGTDHPNSMANDLTVVIRADELRELIAATPAQPDHPECSGDPASCPENEGYGCCKANPTEHPPAPAVPADEPKFQQTIGGELIMSDVMIEAVARALCKSRSLGPEVLHIDSTGEMPMDGTVSMMVDGKIAERAAYFGWRRQVVHARAALEAVAMLAAPQPSPAAAMDWRPATEIPPTKLRTDQHVLIAVRRSHSPDRVWSYPATYANGFPLCSDRSPDTFECYGNGWSQTAADDDHDTADIYVTGFYDVKSTPDGEWDYEYQPALGPDDELVAWALIPQFDASKTGGGVG